MRKCSVKCVDVIIDNCYIMPRIFTFPSRRNRHHASVTQPHFQRRAKSQNVGESEPRTTISFYKYFHIADPRRPVTLYISCLPR